MRRSPPSRESPSQRDSWDPARREPGSESQRLEAASSGELWVRSAGVLLHPTSLPGAWAGSARWRGPDEAPSANPGPAPADTPGPADRTGPASGDLGPAAHDFVDFLAAARQTWWQMLPVGPPGHGRSPYSALSSFAGDPRLVWRAQSDAARGRRSGGRAARPGGGFLPKRAIEDFFERERAWLEDWALFAALRRAHDHMPWPRWDPGLRDRHPPALVRARRTLREEIQREIALQAAFETQWQSLRTKARAAGIRFLGDVPFFVAADSADVWCHREAFDLGSDGAPTAVAGVPPDMFSEDGQLWNMPLYRWDGEAATFWSRRLAATLRRFDAVRLDHFIGFHHVWRVNAGARDARTGVFVAGPGGPLLEQLRTELGTLPLLAEDLGLVTPEVINLRERFDLPGMRVMQFAFGDDDDGYHRPDTWPTRCAGYTATHDNDSTRGWLEALGVAAMQPGPRGQAAGRQRDRAFAYVNAHDPERAAWHFVEAVQRSAAALAIAPMQDLLALGSDARMNVPGVPTGNWTWRLADDAVSAPLAERLADMTLASHRARGAAAP